MLHRLTLSVAPALAAALLAVAPLPTSAAPDMQPFTTADGRLSFQIPSDWDHVDYTYPGQELTPNTPDEFTVADQIIFEAYGPGALRGTIGTLDDQPTVTVMRVVRDEPRPLTSTLTAARRTDVDNYELPRVPVFIRSTDLIQAGTCMPALQFGVTDPVYGRHLLRHFFANMNLSEMYVFLMDLGDNQASTYTDIESATSSMIANMAFAEGDPTPCSDTHVFPDNILYS